MDARGKTKREMTEMLAEADWLFVRVCVCVCALTPLRNDLWQGSKFDFSLRVNVTGLENSWHSFRHCTRSPYHRPTLPNGNDTCLLEQCGKCPSVYLSVCLCVYECGVTVSPKFLSQKASLLTRLSLVSGQRGPLADCDLLLQVLALIRLHAAPYCWRQKQPDVSAVFLDLTTVQMR